MNWQDGARVYTIGVESPGLVGPDVIDLDTTQPAEPGEPAPEVVLLARTPTDLRRAATLQATLPQASRVTVVVQQVARAHPAPSPSLTPAHRWRKLTELRVSRPDPKGWRVDAVFSGPVPAGQTVAAVARAFAGNRLDAFPAPVPVLAGPGAAHWRPGDPNAGLAGLEGPVPLRIGAPAGDLVVRTDAGQAEWAGEERLIDRPGPEALGWDRIGRPGGAALLDVAFTDITMVAPVDDRSVNPTGFLSVPTQGVAELVTVHGRWAVRLDGAELARFPASGAVSDTEVSRLRGLRAIRVDWRRGHSGPLAAVRVIASLAAAGVPLVTGPIPTWAGALGPELIALLAPVTAEELADDLRREEFSVRLRRAALRTHGVHGRWAQLGVARGRAPATSILLATRRPEMVGFALGQAARQRGVVTEVVLALHGVSPDHPSVAGPIAAYQGELQVYDAPAGMLFGEVLNEAADRAGGGFLLKMDDDDWYGPDFLADLLLAHTYSGAEVTGTSPEFVYLSSIDVTVHHEQVTEQVSNFVAGGTILTTRAAFDAVGGFRPLRRSVDTQFLQAVQAAGGQLYRAHGLGYILRRGPAAEHTWREPIGTFLRRNKRQWRGFRPNALMELT
ncbi:glycosyl transferase family 2 [Acrocarpospora catenulata]|uniref:glycosyl transferase family 2 n=1 Tax=Acrocarpospora catenulata TaxID=2836182 RepID=UPI001BDA21AE|nr:glycosyl transferase family 2 [Acrocarpospora catenulata]